MEFVSCRIIAHHYERENLQRTDAPIAGEELLPCSARGARVDSEVVPSPRIVYRVLCNRVERPVLAHPFPPWKREATLGAFPHLGRNSCASDIEQERFGPRVGQLPAIGR